MSIKKLALIMSVAALPTGAFGQGNAEEPTNCSRFPMIPAKGDIENPLACTPELTKIQTCAAIGDFIAGAIILDTVNHSDASEFLAQGASAGLTFGCFEHNKN
ncbi:MAG: hypothetical protein AAF244_04365 [Pseudomonadota bacterium]